MSIEKTVSVILSTTVYRESSLLLQLYSRHHGRMSTIAKGIRRSSERSAPLERGYLIEHTTYVKQHRDLHLITDCSIADHFPGIRGDLDKTALRDVIFDILLASLHGSESGSDLFDRLVDFLHLLENHPPEQGLLIMTLSKMLLETTGHLGFYLDLATCALCGKAPEDRTVFVNIADGNIRCNECAGGVFAEHRPLGAGPRSFLQSSTWETTTPFVISISEAMAVFRTIFDFCRHHLDIRKKLSSYLFMEQLYSSSTSLLPVKGGKATDAVHLQPEHYKECTCQIRK